MVAQKAMPHIPLDATNPHFHSSFVSLPGLLAAIRPTLNDCGLVLTQWPTALEDGTPALRTRLMHGETGEYIEDTMPLLLAKADPQGQGSAITYARRYSLMSALGIAGDTDDDGNAGSRVAASPGRGAATNQPPPLPAGDALDAPVTQTPAPGAASTFKQPAPKEPPADGGDPLEVICHFGKNQGRKLGELSDKQVSWYATVWEPNPQYANDADRRLKFAAQLIHGNPPELLPAGVGDLPADVSEIPF